MKSELLWLKALEVSKVAIDCGALQPLKTIEYKITNSKYQYKLRLLENKTPYFNSEYGPRVNPFIPWDKPLEVKSLSDKHVVILNKYPVQLGHMLLITKQWKPQSGWLDKDDFNEIINIEKDTNGLWFFNSSKEAGASQPHRHIQLLRRGENEIICPREEWFRSRSNKNNDLTSNMNKSISIKTRKSESPYDLYKAYKSLCIKMNVGNIDSDKFPLVPYNLLITNEWIAIIRRIKEKSYGFNINALGFAGYFLGKKNSDIKLLVNEGPEKILNEVVSPII